MKRILTIMIVTLLLTTQVYAEVKVVGDPCYEGDVRLTSQAINLHVPKQLQDAFENQGGFVWIKPLNGYLGSLDNTTVFQSPCVIDVSPVINWDTTRFSTYRQFGNFLNLYNKTLQDPAKNSIVSNELWKYKALCDEVSYTIPEAYSTHHLFGIVAAAKFDGNADIVNTCPNTAALVDSEISNIKTTLSFKVQTDSMEASTVSESKISDGGHKRKTGYRLPITFGN